MSDSAPEEHRLIIVDPNELAGEGLSEAIRGVGGYAVWHARNGVEALALADEHRPNTILTEDCNIGMKVTKLISAAHVLDPEVKVVLCTPHDGEQFDAAAINAGAATTVRKYSTLGEILSAIGGERGSGEHASFAA